MSNARPTEGAGEPLTLALQRVPRERVDMSPVTPSALAHASARDVPGIELRAGNRRVRVGEIFDVSGAGDTVIATFTAALAAGASTEEAAQLANYAGGIVVMKRGTATVSKDELLAALDKTPPVTRPH